MNLQGKSWKTSAAGWLGGLATIVTLAVVPALDDDPATKPDWNTAIVIGGGLIGIGSVARDEGAAKAKWTDHDAQP